MKEFTFPIFCSFGKGDSGESWLDVELTDEEAEQLIKYGTQPDIFYGGFSDCEELSKLYDKIYKLAVEQITCELQDADWLDEEDEVDEDWQADQMYACSVDFPEEFEEMFEDEDEDED